MVNDFREKGFTKMGRVLPSKRIMDLEKDLDRGSWRWRFIYPRLIRQTDCRLGNGGDGFV